MTIIELPISKYKLTFVSEMTGGLYLKIKRDMRKLNVNGANSNNFAIAMPLHTDYFSDLCIKIEAEDGSERVPTQDFLNNLPVSDLKLVENACEDVMTVEKKIS